MCGVIDRMKSHDFFPIYIIHWKDGKEIRTRRESLRKSCLAEEADETLLRPQMIFLSANYPISPECLTL